MGSALLEAGEPAQITLAKVSSDMFCSSIDMPDADKDKRKRAHNEKRKKLQNPLFFVSATRLCVRNLKKAVSDNEFKDLCIKATKEGLQRALVSPDDMDIQLAARGLSIREVVLRVVLPPNPTTDLHDHSDLLRLLSFHRCRHRA